MPYAIPEPASKLHLILLPKYATLADVATLKIDAFRAEYAKDYETARQLWIQVNIAAGGSDMDAIEAIGRFPTWKVQPLSEQVFEFDVVTVNAEAREVKREKGQAQYFAEDSTIGESGRTVKCAACGHSWFVGPEGAGAGSTALGAHEAYRLKVRERRRRKSRAAALSAWTATVAAFLVILTGLVLFRGEVVNRWPESASPWPWCPRSG